MQDIYQLLGQGPIRPRVTIKLSEKPISMTDQQQQDLETLSQGWVPGEDWLYDPINLSEILALELV